MTIPPREDDEIGRAHRERMYMLELGQRVRALREERGLTQHALARAAGIATDMVSRLENGHYGSPGLRTLLRLADGMAVKVAAMLPEPQVRPPATPAGIVRAKLDSLLARASRDDVELTVGILEVVLSKRPRPPSRSR